MVRIWTGEVWVRSTTPGAHVEGILHVPGGMVLGHVEGFEIVILELDVRPLGNRKAEGGKDRG